MGGARSYGSMISSSSGTDEGTSEGAISEGAALDALVVSPRGG